VAELRRDGQRGDAAVGVEVVEDGDEDGVGFVARQVVEVCAGGKAGGEHKKKGHREKGTGTISHRALQWPHGGWGFVKWSQSPCHGVAPKMSHAIDAAITASPRPSNVAPAGWNVAP